MDTTVVDFFDSDALMEAADLIASHQLIVVYFHGTYAFLCDCDAQKPADKIFEIKNRSREKGLSLVVDPKFLPDFIDLTHPAFQHFPLEKSIELQRSLHALGLVFPAGPDAPADLVQNGTIMNVWTEYLPHRPLVQLCKLARAKGVRGFKGASTNLSHEPTYTTVKQVVAQFDCQVPLILDSVETAPEHRCKSTTLVDLTKDRPTMIRSGNVSAEELQPILDQIGFGQLDIASNIKVL